MGPELHIRPDVPNRHIQNIQTTAEYTFVLSAHGIFSRIDVMKTIKQASTNIKG